MDALPADSLLVLVIAGKSAARTKPLLDQLSALQLRWHVVPAIHLDGESCLSLTPTRISVVATRTMTMSEIGCALAHQNAIAAARAAGAGHTLILEDDAELSPGLARLLTERSSLPAYDVILLGRARLSRHEYHLSGSYYPVQDAFRIADLHIGLTRSIRRSGAFAYLVSQQGLQKLQAANLPIQTVADDWPRFMADLEVLQASPLVAYADYPGKGLEARQERSDLP